MPLLIIGGGFLLALAIFALPAFASSPFDIEFPIPELGGCAEKNTCKAYCENPANHDACFAFAAKHGLGASKEEVADTLKELDEDGGPGGCAANAANPTIACKQYCDNASNIEECVLYAKEHNLMDRRELAEAEKVVSALKRGAKLPPQCTDARACKATCEDPHDLQTARACFEFGKEAGLLPEGVSVEQAEKAFTALESGTGPFKSFAEMRQCDNPPNDDVLAKCIQFASDAGFIKPEEAEIIKKTGGKGPGGCRGREQCEAYCETNPEACFAFGQEHGLIREEDKARMQEGVGEMRRALDQAPPEVTQCIREAIPNLDAILSGQAFPSPALGNKMQSCFESFFRSQAIEGVGGFGDHEGGFGGPPGAGGFPGGGVPPGGGFGEGFKGDRPCPQMPTVDSCGPDEDLVGQEVPGCGFYGRCVPKGSGTPGKIPPSFEGHPPPPGGEFHPPEGTDYQKQYQAEVERQIQQQTTQQIEAQTRLEQSAQQPSSGTTYPSGTTHPPPPPPPPPPPATEYQAPAPSYTPPSSGESHPTYIHLGPNQELIGSVWQSLRQLRQNR